jgi:K+-transporting ATPase KdpF subunit
LRLADAFNEAAMTLESIVGLVISVLLLAYLVYAMLRPEKF